MSASTERCNHQGTTARHDPDLTDQLEQQLMSETELLVLIELSRRARPVGSIDFELESLLDDVRQELVW